MKEKTSAKKKEVDKKNIEKKTPPKQKNIKKQIKDIQKKLKEKELKKPESKQKPELKEKNQKLKEQENIKEKSESSDNAQTKPPQAIGEKKGPSDNIQKDSPEKQEKSEKSDINKKSEEELKPESKKSSGKNSEKNHSNQSSSKKPILETYKINVDKAGVRIEITKELSGIVYNLHSPKIGIATASLLERVREELVTTTTISMKEITDPAAFVVIKKRFMLEAETQIKEILPSINQNLKEFLIGRLMQDMLGLGGIEFLVNDPYLEEIVIPSSKEPIRVYHKKYGWLPTNLRINKEDEIVNYSNIIARRVGKQITVLAPLLDAHLVSGDRVNAILYPIATKGNTITIRKFARDPYTIVDLINNKTCSIDIAVLLWIAIEYEMNVLISGGTASGKTVLLNACMPFIPPNNRIISVEDTRELMLPDFLYWTPLVTRTPNPEGKGEVSMLNLLVNSLRMRPDRIVLGEMRRQEEAMVLFEAMHTGHSVYATVHADSAAETISRLTHPPLNVPPNLLKAVNLNVIMFRDRKRGIRRVFQIAEFNTTDERAEANIIYRWIPEQDKVVKHAESSRFFEDISRNTGMSQEKLNQNLEEKKQILLWLIKNKIRDLNDFGKIINIYYTNKESLFSSMKKNEVKKLLSRE